MDPRRARDPRLARADPRLQRSQDSVLPVLAVEDAPMDTEDDFSQIESHPPTQNTTTQTEVAEENLEPIPLQFPSFKPRPLFCVVCASNQVSMAVLRSHTHNMVDF